MEGTSDTAIPDRLVDLLRLSGNETQLTRAMGVLMRDDENLCRSTVAAMLRLADPGGALPARTRLKLDNETPAMRTRRFGDRRLGRVDWRFSDADNPCRFQLIVEVKIDSRPGVKQFERYLADDRVTDAEFGGVLALTKHPLSGDELPGKVRRHPRWRGHVRWHALLPELLGDAHHLDASDNAVIWRALLRRAAEPGDLGAALPDWIDLRAASSAKAADIRSAVLRAAVDEIKADLDDRRYPIKVLRRGERLLVAVGYDRINALELELRGTDAPTLHVAFWPPSRPVRGKAWDNAVRSLLRLGWTVDDKSLRHEPIVLEPSQRPLHLSVAAALVEALEPLRAELLPRYWAVTVGGVAKREHLKAVEARG